ncbi:30S ribosomal protein S1 [Bacillaceae bacterium CLA-AA-H227]|uniref:30S ribosomal protein S1 n=1 Tax=Robertmurraya yapensis (ex Hitch et al 2024) TaxID=3133160 RepID=A0ACC6SGK2_9BACI
MADQALTVLVEGYDPQKALEATQSSSLDLSSDWQDIYAARQNGTILQGELIGIESPEPDKTYGIVQVGFVNGYLPMQEAGEEIKNINQFRSLIGSKIVFKVTNLLREQEQFVASRKEALKQMQETTWKRLKKGQDVIAVVRDVRMKTVKLEIGGVTVKMGAEEYDHKFINDLRDELKVGDHMQVKVLSVDSEKKEVKVSAKALKENMWDDIAKHLRVKGEYSGIITGIAEFGVFINIRGNVDALAPHLKFDKFKKGDKVLIRLLEIQPKTQHIRAKIIRKLG